MYNTIKFKFFEWIIKSKGFLTAKGQLIDYIEWHSLGIGLIDGFWFKSQNYQRHVHNSIIHHPEVRKETHYYKLGYFISNRVKWGFFLWILL